MANKKSTTKAYPKVKATTATPRRRKSPQYKSFHLNKRIKNAKPPIPNAFIIMRDACLVLWQHKKLFGGILLVYMILTIVLVRGLTSGTDIQGIKEAIDEAFKGSFSQFSAGVALFGILLGSAGNTTSQVAGAYQSMLVLLVSLVLIWTLRQVQATEAPAITVKEAFYKSMYPLIQFLLVLLVICLQFLPLILAASVYSLVSNNGLAVTPGEQFVWGTMVFLFGVLSFYMVTSSVFALYIVTLPDMQPMRALKSARELVRYRRWMIMRKFLFLPIALLVACAVITVPVIIFLTPLAEWVFFILSIIGLSISHSYMYRLYRELL